MNHDTSIGVTRDAFPVIDLFQDQHARAPRLVLSALRTAWLLDQVVARSLLPYKLHYAQFHALLLLHGRDPDGVRPSTIGEFLSVSRPNVTKLLARLQARHLIEERPDPEDGRAIRAFITAEGRTIVEKAAETLFADLDRVIATLPRDDAKSLQGLLDGFRDAVATWLRAPTEAA